jgi:hypothetical protein
MRSFRAIAGICPCRAITAFTVPRLTPIRSLISRNDIPA